MRYFRSMIKEFFDMSYITITTEKNETYSSISNFFIDYYMTSASGEFVKVYLYLVRLMSSSKPVSVANIADHFNLTEKDICRAIKYWISQDVMKLNYNKKKELTGITLLPLHDKGSSSDSGVDDLSILGMDYSTGDDDNNSEITATITDEDKAENFLGKNRRTRFSLILCLRQRHILADRFPCLNQKVSYTYTTSLASPRSSSNI